MLLYSGWQAGRAARTFQLFWCNSEWSSNRFTTSWRFIYRWHHGIRQPWTIGTERILCHSIAIPL